jgi:hypothetical protein
MGKLSFWKSIMTDSTDMTSAEDLREKNSDKIRGRIPKSAWAYVRGQYELAGRTYEDIGNEFNSTPSAVFYVVKQARDRGVEPSLEKPSEEVMQAARGSLEPRVARSRSESPAKSSAVEQMAQQANAMLTNETCKRLFDATSDTIVSFVGFEAEPNEQGKKLVKEALHAVRRAMASLELKVEMMPLLPANSQAQATQTEDVA